MRMVLDIPPDLQMLLMTKPLRERLAKDAFEQATQTNQTSLNDTVGEETRWLVVFPRISLVRLADPAQLLRRRLEPAARRQGLARRAARRTASSAPPRAG